MGSTVAKLFFIVLLISLQTRAQIFSLPFGGDGQASIDQMITALGKLDSDASDFEEKFRQNSLEIERQLDIMRSDCQEKSADASGRQRCFRDVIARHKKYLETSFEAKKNLLGVLHKRQMTQLEQSREQALKEIEKQF